MHAIPTATLSDSERNELRALIEQQTKAFEEKNGAIQTTDIIRKEQSADYWKKSSGSDRVATGADAQKRINQIIIEQYSAAPCLATLAKELELPSIDSLSKRASRLGVQRDQSNHPNKQRAEERMEQVGKLLDAGKPVLEISKKLAMPERSVRYYRQRLASINKAADGVEQTIKAMEARTK